MTGHHGRRQPYADAPLTYDEVGMSLSGAPPAGWDHLRRSRVVGRWRADLDLATERLMTFGMHRRAGFVVEASSARAELGTVVVLRPRLLPAPLARRLVVPCRVVRVVDEPDRRGFAYGTLPGHPERGEESFVVDVDARGVVRAHVTAVSRPAWRIARVLAPAMRVVQHVAARAYLRALVVGRPPRWPGSSIAKGGRRGGR